jgi:superfamily II DNA or RNA helicase
MLDLRPYQTGAIEAVEAAEREGTRRPLVVHPTGTGKTVTFSHLIAQRADQGRALVLVHRDELAAQTVAKIGMIAPELRTGIVKANINQVDAAAVVASVQTVQNMDRLMEILAHGDIRTVVVDEAHHAPAPSWTRVLTRLGSFSEYGPLTVGFTATPERDGKALGVWEKVVSYMSIREAIYGGYLVSIHGQTVATSMDLGRVRKTRGDYQDGDLGEALEDSGAIEEIADAYLEHAKDRKGVAFTPTIKTAEHLAEALRARGIAAEALSGQTPTEERRAILARLKTGATQVVTNCAVLTEGFDEPSISCVVVARPTKFHGLYVQMVGRGTRLYPGKKDLLVLDVTGASERHDLVSVVDLGLETDETRTKKEGEREEQECPTCEVPGSECNLPHHRCALCHRFLPVRVVMDGMSRHENCQAGRTGKVDVFATSRLRWLPVENGWCLGAGQEVVIMLPAGLDTWRLAAYRNGRVQVIHEQLPADWAMGIGEDRAKAFQKLVERSARWLGQPVTDAQKGRLIREGFPAEKLGRIRTSGEAADLITRIQARRGVRKLVG